MPNAYLSLSELRAAVPDALKASVTKYDAQMLRLLSEASRFVDNYCKREFYPYLATRYFRGSGGLVQRIPDLLSITSVSYSDDDGTTYTALSASDYYATVAGNHNSLKSYDALELNINSTTLSYWPCGQRSIKIVGVWGYCDDRNLCWQSTGDRIYGGTLTSSATSMTLNDVDGLDIYGAAPRFQAGGLYRIESEYVEATLTQDTTSNTLGILRGRNGTTAASHVEDTVIDAWQAPEPVKQAIAISVFKHLQRGFQGFGDARSTPELGQLFFLKSLDPDAVSKLTYYVNELVF